MQLRQKFILPAISATSRLRRRCILAAASLAIATSLVTGALPANSAISGSGGDVYVGGMGDVATLERVAGKTVSHHLYASFSSSVPSARMITVSTPGRWSAVASVQPGSALYSDIVRWADQLKSRGGIVMLAYQHEPEVTKNLSRGTNEDFKNAFRKIVTIMRSRGATNVRFTWQMTAWSFRASSSARDFAAKWYPGNEFVDVVGADAYNWYVCGHGQGKWQEFSTLAEPVLAFATAHGKQAAFPEYASHRDPRRATWLHNAHMYLKAHSNVIAAAYYFNRPPTNLVNNDCRWPLGTTQEYTEFKSLANDAFASA